MNTANERERPTCEWYGNPPLEDQSVESLAERANVATAAKGGDWTELLSLLKNNSSLVNSFRPGGHSWFTPLHQAAYHNAPRAIVLELIHLGAFRTLRNSSGERPVDIARKKGFDGCADLLEPEVRCPADPLQLASIQELFHGLVRAVSLKYRIAMLLRLPELSVLTEFDDLRLWFPIPGMYGGFNIWLEPGNGQSALIAESWCRVVDGSGMRHRVTSTQVVLLEAGFV
jgi:hypothetical protein